MAYNLNDQQIIERLAVYRVVNSCLRCFSLRYSHEGVRHSLMAVSNSRQNVIKLTPALSNPTIPVGRQIARDTPLD